MIDLFSKYSWVKLLNYKKVETVSNSFIEILNESHRKTNKLWFDQGKKEMQKWLNEIDILTYLTRNESNFVVPESFIRTLKTKSYKK